jgi:hypothetical protein
MEIQKLKERADIDQIMTISLDNDGLNEALLNIYDSKYEEN